MSHQLPPCFILTIDVEDWFQVENLRPWFPHENWSGCELRVERNVNMLLDLFDQASSELIAHRKSVPKGDGENRPSLSATSYQLRATFFVLGWIAERLPHLVREIAARGHEVASHGYSHRMCSQLPVAELREDLVKSKHILEDILGVEVAGFRAPNFSVDDRVLKLVAEAGYSYDSSYNNFDLHGRYGKISLNGQPKNSIAHKLSDNFFELPISNLPLITFPILGTLAHFRQSHLPWGGGAYFRLVPQFIFMSGVRRILNRSGAYSFYMHPWEIDPGQPKVRQASYGSRFKHYTNLTKTAGRLQDMIREFVSCRFLSCREYIENVSDTPAVRGIAKAAGSYSYFNSINPINPTNS
jgi:polysaccharide deacetylase family protein (PEP-CTERM system associated)